MSHAKGFEVSSTHCLSRYVSIGILALSGPGRFMRPVQKGSKLPLPETKLTENLPLVSALLMPVHDPRLCENVNGLKIVRILFQHASKSHSARHPVLPGAIVYAPHVRRLFDAGQETGAAAVARIVGNHACSDRNFAFGISSAE